MLIHGLQKMTLLDFPGHVACTVFLSGCDLRCPFCHNFELAENKAPALMTDEEFFAFLKKRSGLLDGVAVTGGEPCLNAELPGFLKRCRDMGFMTKLDTNGHHPKMLERVLSEGLADYVAMDIKNSPRKYAMTAGVKHVDMDRIRSSIALLMGGDTDYEFRTTVVREFHEEDDLRQIGGMIAGAKRYFLQSFTDRDTVPFGGFSAPDRQTLEKYAAAAREYVPNTGLRGVD